jgi:glycosyltransferase involved in cell wall biosynthesis
MLSICIPIFNQDVTALVEALSSQIEVLKVPAEIVLIDDCSAPNYQENNESICQKHIYHKLKSNVGRAKIRNLFLDYVHYDYLLFLDCDATIISTELLQNYIDTIKVEKHQVYCGGSIYPKDKPEKKYRLRWTNGHIRETIPAEIRNQNPFSSFMTSNVLIRKDVFDHIRFDEKIVKYGHEDTLFGLALKKKGIPIFHINNNVLNDDLDSNTEFLSKTEDALTNLAYITQSLEYDKDLIDEIKILKFYFLLRNKSLLPLVNIAFRLSKGGVKKLLLNGFCKLYLFDFYKIGTLSKAFSIR